MDDAMMGAAKSKRLQHMIGVADKVPVGKEQELDDVPAQARARGAADRSFRPLGRIRRSIWKIYVSHVDISWFQCYKNSVSSEILGRFVGDAGTERPLTKQRGGSSREFLFRVIVDRRFAKHTGLRAFRKSLSSDMIRNGSRLWGGCGGWPAVPTNGAPR